MDVATVERQRAFIADQLRRLLLPGQIVQIAGRHPFRSETFATAVPGQVEAAASFATNLNGRCKAIGWTLNPLRSVTCSGSHGAAKVEDFAGRRWLFVDLECVGHSEHNATDDEKAKSFQVATSIRDTLLLRGFGGIVLADSGNGWHLYVPVDLPANDQSREAHKAFLHRLQERFGTDVVVIDGGTSSIDRKGKVPGTLTKRTDESPGRPHHWARIVQLPDDPHASAAANNDCFAKVLQDWHVRKDEKAVKGAWVAAAFQKEVGRVLTARETDPGRHNQLYASACALGELVAGGELDANAVEQALMAAALANGLPESERATVRDGMKKGGTNPRTAPSAGEPSRNGTAPSQADSRLPSELLIWADTIEPRDVEWLWPGRIPVGMLTTFAGVTSVGKTFTTCDITARVSMGGEWPSTNGECAVPGKVLFISGEDDPSVTLVPRMIECGADLKQIAFLKTEVADKFLLSDVPLIEKLLVAMDGVRLVAIDPPTAFLGEIDDHKNAQLRRVLSPLKSVAAKFNVAMIFITHFNKPTAAKTDAMMRVVGSVAWVNAVRAAYVLAEDPEDADRRLFLPLKLNVGPKPKGLAYKIASTKALAKVEWAGEVDTTADEAASRIERQPRKRQASYWMIELFRQKQEWSSSEFWASAREHGVSRNAVNEARDLLKLPRPRRIVHSSGEVDYIWHVPADWPYLHDTAMFPPIEDRQTG